jgi:hypothetical protein
VVVSTIFSIIKAVPAARDIFFAVQDLYYNNYFENLSVSMNDRKGKRRALSNSIAMARTDEDRQHLSIMLAESYVMSNRRRKDSGEA